MKKTEAKSKNKEPSEKEINDLRNSLIELLLLMNRLSRFFEESDKPTLSQMKNFQFFKYELQESFFEHFRKREEEIEKIYMNDIFRSISMGLCFDNTNYKSKLGFLINLKKDLRQEGS